MNQHLRFMFNGNVPDTFEDDKVDRQEILVDEIMTKLVNNICQYYMDREPSGREIENMSEALRNGTVESVASYLHELVQYIAKRLVVLDKINVVDNQGYLYDEAQLKKWIIERMVEWSGQLGSAIVGLVSVGS